MPMVADVIVLPLVVAVGEALKVAEVVVRLVVVLVMDVPSVGYRADLGEPAFSV